MFVTGTDTGVGKSFFSARLALFLCEQTGKKIAITKPIQTGFPQDTEVLKKLTKSKIPIFNTYSFSLPAAPSVSASNENKIIDIKKIIDEIKILEKEFDCLIVEGIGGIAVPITFEDHPYLVSDLIKDLNYPTVIISRPNLGTINHTTLTIEHAKNKNINLLGFIISNYDFKSTDKVILTASEEIEKNNNIKCLMKI